MKVKLDNEIKARLTPDLKNRLKLKARQESRKRGLLVTPSKLTREWITERLTARAA